MPWVRQGCSGGRDMSVYTAGVFVMFVIESHVSRSQSVWDLFFYQFSMIGEDGRLQAGGLDSLTTGFGSRGAIIFIVNLEAGVFEAGV